MSAARIIGLVALAIVTGAAAPARADDGEPVRALPIHAEAAITIAGGDDIVSVAFRGYLGASVKTPGSLGRWKPFLGAGLHLGSGSISVEEPRSLDGSVDLRYQTIGPEVRAGLVFVNGGYVDSQLYIAAAPLTVGVDRRLMYDAVGGVVGGDGLRLAVGLTFADVFYEAMSRRRFDEDRDDRMVSAIVAIFVPVTIEATYERSAGFARAGVSFGWGF